MSYSYANSHQRPRTHGSSTLAEDRFIPGVWNIFDPYNPYLRAQQQQQQQQQHLHHQQQQLLLKHQLTAKQQQQLLREEQAHLQLRHSRGEWTPTGARGVSTSRDPQQQHNRTVLGHVNWSQKNQDELQQWCDRSFGVDRPRTYDRYYEKTPSNFHSTPSLNRLVAASSTTMIAASQQSPAQDSAVSLGEDDEEVTVGPSQRRVKRSKKRRELQYSRTVTERDVRHLERQLSMKKTIRKKIMRDLQQAFVGDPSRLETLQGLQDTDQARPGSDLASALHFGEARVRALSASAGEQRFLDLLKDSSGCPVNNSSSEDSGHGGSPDAGAAGRHKFRSVRERPTHTRTSLAYDYSSTDDNEHAGGMASRFQQQPRASAVVSGSDEEEALVAQVEDKLAMQVEQIDKKSKGSKRSFWNFLKKKK